MTDSRELENLIHSMKSFGAVVLVDYDLEAFITEHRDIINSVTISNVRGIGPYPMSPIAAAEAMRKALANTGKMVKDARGNFVVAEWLRK